MPEGAAEPRAHRRMNRSKLRLRDVLRADARHLWRAGEGRSGRRPAGAADLPASSTGWSAAATATSAFHLVTPLPLLWAWHDRRRLAGDPGSQAPFARRAARAGMASGSRAGLLLALVAWLPIVLAMIALVDLRSTATRSAGTSGKSVPQPGGRAVVVRRRVYRHAAALGTTCSRCSIPRSRPRRRTTSTAMS